jgi:3-isopropylmalate/(R)-2-methylmalate dehydratase small subunit
MVTRTGYGELLFKDVRGESFALDLPAAQGASILVTGTNFGSGSSREHAVWALQQAGFNAVIAKSTETSAGFSDIFRQNAANNGLLILELTDPAHAMICSLGQGSEITISLTTRTVSVNSESIPFAINPAVRSALLEGRDLIGSTMMHEREIAAHEQSRGPWRPPKAQ